MSKYRPDWTCCGRSVFGSKARCGKCNRLNPAIGVNVPPKNAGDWSCAKCNDLQFASRTHCRKCNEPKPPAVAAVLASAVPAPPLRPGDWLCKVCNDVQFGSRNTCRKCNASKPVADDAPEDDACLICMIRERNAALVHEGEAHTVACLECANDIVKAGGACPMCRRRVESVVKLFK